MKFNVILCLFTINLFSAFLALGQHATSVGSAINVSSGQGVFFNTVGGGTGLNPKKNLTLETGEYLFKSWNKGIIIGMAKQQVKFDKMNYNLETQTLEIERNNKKEHFTPDMVKGFVVQVSNDSTQNITFISLLSSPKLRGNMQKYYQLLADGKIALLLKYEVVVTQGSFNPVLNVGDKPKLVVQNIPYYFDGTDVVALKRTKKGLLKIFPEHKEKMEAFINSKDLDNFDDLKAIFDYYNGL
jgi:hypothetical protein